MINGTGQDGIAHQVIWWTESRSVAPCPWHQGTMAHQGKKVFDANDNHIFTVHCSHEPDAVTIAARIVAAINAQESRRV